MIVYFIIGVVCLLVGFLAGVIVFLIGDIRVLSDMVDEDVRKNLEAKIYALEDDLRKIKGPSIRWTKGLQSTFWEQAKILEDECQGLSHNSRVRAIESKFNEISDLIRLNIRDEGRPIEVKEG